MHSDLESTMVYLKYVRRKDIHELLDNSEMAGLAAQPLASPGEASVLTHAGSLTAPREMRTPSGVCDRLHSRIVTDRLHGS